MSDFMQKRLSQLLKDLDRLTPQEISAELLSLARVADMDIYGGKDTTASNYQEYKVEMVDQGHWPAEGEYK